MKLRTAGLLWSTGPIMRDDLHLARLFGVAVCALVLSTFALSNAAAAEVSARSFVEQIYKRYQGVGSKGVQLTAKGAQAYFTRSLAELLIRDQREAKGGIGRLDFDPFINGQDWDVTALRIQVDAKGPDRAVAVVNFRNAGTQTVVTHDLIRTRAGWRIDDIHWAGVDASLRRILVRQAI